MPRLVIVLPLESLRTGESFLVPEWPLHVTVLSPFATEEEPHVLAEVVTRTVAGFPVITAVAGGDELFGRRHNIPVTLITANPALTELRRLLVENIRPFASVPSEPAFTGTDFRPHVTIKQGRRVDVADELLLDQIALVDMAARSLPHGRTVLATFPLGLTFSPGLTFPLGLGEAE